jgi:hypothetical protein
MHRSKDVPMATPQPQSIIDTITQLAATGMFASPISLAKPAACSILRRR